MKGVLIEHSGLDRAKRKRLHTTTCCAMTVLSAMEEVVPPGSLLIANPSDRTIRVGTILTTIAEIIAATSYQGLEGTRFWKAREDNDCNDGSAFCFI